jgi:hypothetical protein
MCRYKQEDGLMDRLDFRDLDTDSLAFVVIRPMDDSVAVGFGLEANGDLDLLVSREDARRIGQAFLAAAGSA